MMAKKVDPAALDPNPALRLDARQPFFPCGLSRFAIPRDFASLAYGKKRAVGRDREAFCFRRSTSPRHLAVAFLLPSLSCPVYLWGNAGFAFDA